MGEQASSTGYGTVVGDASATVGLTNAVVDLVQRPISYYWRRRSDRQTLLARLGEWGEEAVDKRGRWLQPVLQKSALEEHLIKSDGHCLPVGEHTADLGWSHLLYALGIRPGAGIVRWRLPHHAIDPLQAGSMELEIDGAAIAHIINFFRIYQDSCPKDFGELSDSSEPTANSTDRSKRQLSVRGCTRLSFGTLSHVSGEAQVAWSFETVPLEELSKPRVPFMIDHYDGECAGLALDVNSTFLSYHQALALGASNNKVLFPPANANPELRLAKLLQVYVDCNSGRSGPCLFTRQWLEEASRIKRRITTNGGNDLRLCDAIVEALREDPVKQDSLARAYADEFRLWNLPQQGTWETAAPAHLKSLLMTTRQWFDLTWRPGYLANHPSYFDQPFRDHLHGGLRDALATVLASKKIPWWQTFAPEPKALADLLKLEHDWQLWDTLCLEFTRESRLWTSACIIQG